MALGSLYMREGSAEVTNDFLTRPYLVEPATIRGAKIYFQPRRTIWMVCLRELLCAHRK